MYKEEREALLFLSFFFAKPPGPALATFSLLLSTTNAHAMRNELLTSSEPVEKCASLTREECEDSLVKEDP